MNDLLSETPSQGLAPVIELLSTLDACGVTPAALNVEWQFTNQTTPHLILWLRYRTEFEHVTSALKLKTGSRMQRHDQQHFFTIGAGPLIQCVSFPHHDDWAKR